jgi:ATP-binding cassette subfamily B protein
VSRIRVYELARDVGRPSREVLGHLTHMGVEVASHTSTIDERIAAQLRARLRAGRRRPGAANAVAPVRRLRELLRPHAGRLAALLGVDLLSVPMVLLAPLPLKVAVDSVLGDQPLPGFLQPFVPDVLTTTTGRLLVVAALLQVAVVLLAEVQRLSSYVLHNVVGERITLGLRARLFHRAQRLSLTHHDTKGSADTAYRIEWDAPSVQYLVDGTIPLVASATMLVATLWVTAAISWPLAAVAMVVGPVLFWLSRAHLDHFRRSYREVKELESVSLGIIGEVLSSLRAVKAFGREDTEADRFVGAARRGATARVRLSLREGTYGLLVNLTTAVGTAAVLVIGVQQVQSERISLGDLLLILGYLAMLYQPLKDVSQKVGDLQSAVAGMERGFELLDTPQEAPEPTRPVEIGRAAGAITFQRVSFAYPDGKQVLDDVSFDVPAGSRVGIVGRTGAGKSTLVNLLLRFYDPDLGRILLDGTDVRNLRVEHLRDQFAIVLQDPVLFSTSIGDNIAYGRPGATHADIARAAEAANADAFIRQFRDGYDTPVGERGMRLSGGERQRIALARAFLRDAPLLVLDEPTSAVDVGTESGILEALERLMEGRTTLTIAHRLNTVAGCDLWLQVDERSVRQIASATGGAA